MGQKIKILSTSDIHGYIYPYDYGTQQPKNHGLARMKTLIDSIRDENTILIDNGDVLEGSPLTFYHYHYENKGKNPLTDAYKLLEYDYLNVGNHDFNYGMEELHNFLDEVGAPCITANIIDNGTPIGFRYAISEVLGKKVGIFGLCTQHIPFWENPANIVGVEFLDAFKTAKEIVKEMKEKDNPDYIVCVYHGSFERDLATGEWFITNDPAGNENEGYQMLDEIPDIDIMISGHQHCALCGKAFNTAYTQTLPNGQQLSCIEIDIETNEITPSLIDVDCEADESVMAVAQDVEDRCQKWMDTTLGTTEIDLTVHDQFHDRLEKPQIVTFMNMVEKDVLESDLQSNALFSGAVGLKEVITMRDLINTYVFPNTLALKQINGKILKEYLEKSAEFWTIRDGEIGISDAANWPDPFYHNYDMVDGIEYTIKVSNPIGERIVELLYQGKPVEDDMTFTLALNSYRAMGGGDFNMIRNAPTLKEDLRSMVEIIAKYIEEKKVINFEPVHNIKVIK